MKIEEGQKKQFIVLCCLIVFVIGFGVYKVVGAGGHAAPPPAPRTQASEQIAVSTDQPAGTGEQGAGAVVSLAAAAARDPFAPQIAPEAGGASGSRTSQVSPPLLGPSGKLPITIMPPLPFADTMQVTQGTAGQQVHEDPAGQLKLTGVIEGSTKVAIIRGSDNTRYIVREGQRIDGKYQVESISRFGVRIRFRDNKFVLRLGGSDAIKHGARA